MFAELVINLGEKHDQHKLETFERFFSAFAEGFASESWWNDHKKEHHHMADKNHVDMDVINLAHVLEYISDCVMSGMARSGEVTPVTIDPEVLIKAFKNTVELLKTNVEVQ